MQKMYHVLLLQKDSLHDSVFGVNEQLHYFSLICQPLTEGFKEILNPLKNCSDIKLIAHVAYYLLDYSLFAP